MKTQVSRILNSKIASISRTEYDRANPAGAKRHHAYSLPQCVHDMVAMLGRIESATAGELEAMAHYATTGEVFERSTKRAS